MYLMHYEKYCFCSDSEFVDKTAVHVFITIFIGLIICSRSEKATLLNFKTLHRN